MVDNWSGATLLPSLYYGLSAQPRQHTYIFIGFTHEQEGTGRLRLLRAHNPRDGLSNMEMDDYYASYALIAVYLAYLDDALALGRQSQPTQKSSR